jgi:transcriptional regulator with XRE-family HTH domain
MAFLFLKLRRLQKGWNQTDVARLARLTQQEISLIEQGRLIPRPHELVRLAQIFGVAPSEILEQVPAPDEVQS